APYERVVVGDSLPPYERGDRRHVAVDAERPSDRAYDRYLWLIEELRAARYDDAAVASTLSFRVGDVFVTAVLAAASDALVRVGVTIGAPDGDVAWLDELARAARAAVVAATDPATGLAVDV